MTVTSTEYIVCIADRLNHITPALRRPSHRNTDLIQQVALVSLDPGMFYDFEFINYINSTLKHINDQLINLCNLFCFEENNMIA